MQPNAQELRQALVSVVGDIAKQGYAVAADARLHGVENELGRWTTLTDEEKSKLWSAMQTGQFVLFAGSMTYLTRCGNRSTTPTWDLAHGQCMRSGREDDFDLFGLGSAQFDLDTSWMSAIQVERLEGARARWVELHRGDLAALVDKAANGSSDLNSVSQYERRVLLREARRLWNQEQPYLSESQKSSLQAVISNLWKSISPRWWEFGLRSRPKELRA